MRTIELAAFRETSNLKSVTIPENITTILRIAFAESGIERVEFAGNINYMDTGAFQNCENLKEVTGLTDTKLAQFWQAFSGTPFQTKKIDDAHPFIVDPSKTLVAYIGTKQMLKFRIQLKP